ncbi:hypothetical protein HHK36_019158 [Tetracentron sinense]|uniref:Uncharacterized protein n=1 Tax=Tetracentron sinense TaxID=13715 RepID=A0A834YWV7_TETSI|nr:hypothetical protein HHK36_019158 [Tetracentron sinense]
MKKEIITGDGSGDADVDEGGSGVAVGDGSGSGSGRRVGSGSEDRVKGPWSPEEDAILSRLVSKFGARNWTLIARGISGRSGKSCRLRWCNQLDPCVKRKPFTASGDMLEDASLDKAKASSEETLSCGDANSFKFLEGQDVVSSLENISNQYEDKAQTKEDHCSSEAKDPPTLFRPVARVSAFSVYNPFDGPTIGSLLSRTAPMHGPLVQVSKPDVGICKLLEGVCGETLVPPRCGHGCCATQSGEHPQSSLLGPEFVEYVEPPPFSSHELASIATDLSNIAWLKSGLENSGASLLDNAAGRTTSQVAQAQMGHLERHMKNDHLRFEEGRNKLTSMMTEVLSTQMARQPLALPAEVGGLS